MQYLKLENITKSYGEKVLFENINLTINKGDKIALLAKNGSGKTTLMKVLAGEESGEGEQARTAFTKGISVSFLAQEPLLDNEKNILEEIFTSDFPAIKAIRSYEEALLGNDDSKIQESIASIEALGAWDIEAKIKEILSKLKITKLDQKIGVLSGGEKKRVALTKLLIEEPDFIIMDEPTNHLDIEMIEWLEEYFKNPNRTLFVVTHDRYFIEAVCKEILELDQGMMQAYRGGYSDYLIKKEERLQNAEVAHQKLSQRFKKELEWVRRQPKARGTKSKARKDNFKEIKKTVHSYKTDETLSIDIKESRLGSKIIEAINVHKAFDTKTLVKGFEYKFKKGDRIGIVGPNGIGKSTFLQLITKQLEPDIGKVIHGETLKIGYYKQTGLTLKKEKKVIDVIRDIADYIPLEKGRKLMAEQLLENFLFSRAQQQQLTSTLSGGERKRLYLLSILMENPNFLILDEPTNDLDIVTLNILEEYLFQFKGCVIIVSHDRYFMDRLVEHLFVFKGAGEIKDFNGNYTDYSNVLKEEKKPSTPKKTAASVEKSANKLSHEQRKELRNLEKSIKKLEEKKVLLEERFLDSSLSAEKLHMNSVMLEELKEKIEEKEMAWLELSEG